MEIGLIYSNKDPKQIETRDFVRNYIREHGILANLVETEQEVSAPTISINGRCITGSFIYTQKSKPRFLKLTDIAKAIEQNIWSL